MSMWGLGMGRDESGAAVLDAFAKQIGWCDSLRASFTARLLRLLADPRPVRLPQYRFWVRQQAHHGPG